MVTMNELLQELEQEAHATRRVLERVPPDRLGWKPHEKSMTLGQLALHVATLPRAIAEVSTHPTFDVKTQIPGRARRAWTSCLPRWNGASRTPRRFWAGWTTARSRLPGG